MKPLAALLLALCAFAAQAVDAIGPCTDSAPPPIRPTSASPYAMPKGYPYSLASCTLPVVGYNANGWALGWGCRDGAKVYTATYAVRHSAITADMTASFAAIPFAPDPRAAAQAHWHQYGTQHFLGMADVWCEASGSDWRIRFNSALRPLIDEALAYSGPTWRVPPAGSSVYSISTGSRVLLIGRRAAGGSLCDCTVKIQALSLTYCPLAGGPAAEVASCRQDP